MAKRTLIRNHGPVKDNVIRALVVAIKDAQSIGTKLIHLIVPSKSAFSGNVVSEVVGDEATKQLLKGGTVPIKDGISIKLESPGTVKNSKAVTVALAVYLGARDLRAIDGLGNVKGIIYLPWIAEDGEGWQQSWGAEIFGEKLSENKLELHPELEKKLASLTNRINLSTGFGHPSDLKAVKQMFREIVEESLSYEPKTVRSWALRNGWRPDFAEDLYDLAVKSHGN
jgi:hypothetical protein